MSNIIKNKEDLILMKDFINYVNKNGITKSCVEELLNSMLPSSNDTTLVSCTVLEKGHRTAYFEPVTKKIQISINKLKDWVDGNVLDLSEKFNIRDKAGFDVFLLLIALAHEVEHAYQFLISQGEVEAPNILIKKCYKGIFDLMLPQHYLFPRPIKKIRTVTALTLYKIREDDYILERNANVESMDLVCSSSLFMNREEYYRVFDTMRRIYSMAGYTGNNKGSFEETYRNILMYNKYKKIINDFGSAEIISEEERARYGLEIKEETRQKVLQLN